MEHVTIIQVSVIHFTGTIKFRQPTFDKQYLDQNRFSVCLLEQKYNVLFVMAQYKKPTFVTTASLKMKCKL